MVRNTNGSGFSLKDELFNAKKVAYLSTLLSAADEQFDTVGFEKAVNKELSQLELKARIMHIATCLEKFLPANYEQAIKVILKALPPPLDPHKTDNDFGSFIFAPFGEYVVRNGLSDKYLNLSLVALRELTKRFSMEFYIRPFIDAYQVETLKELRLWMTDEHYHVRRLVSEGTRARLPWAGRISIDPLAPLEFLEVLHTDAARYVTRSVANHLNDITKIDPDIVVTTLKRWQHDKKQGEKELAWITRHALRTSVKAGHQASLKLLGYQPNPRISVSQIELKQSVVQVGEAVVFSFLITADCPENLLIDYVVDFVKANGTTQPKVHKITTVHVLAGETLKYTKRHHFRAGATTLSFYPGRHTVTLQINGRRYTSADFELQV